MSNPVFTNSDIFGDPNRKPRSKGAARAGTVQDARVAPGFTGAQVMDATTLEKLYDGPTATTAQTGRLTYDDVIVKTAGLLALLVVVAAATWQLAPGLFFVGMLVGLVLGLINSFKKSPSPALITAYVVAEGVFLGGISHLLQDYTYKGVAVSPIVLQAVIATLATFGAALFLFKSGRVRVTPKFTRFLLVGMLGYMAFTLLNLGLSFVMPSSDFGPLRNGGWGVIAGLVAVGLAAASLIMDFDSIKRGVEQGVPAKFAWSAAFGLIVTLVWLYLEFLRLFAILAGGRR